MERYYSSTLIILLWYLKEHKSVSCQFRLHLGVNANDSLLHLPGSFLTVILELLELFSPQTFSPFCGRLRQLAVHTTRRNPSEGHSWSSFRVGLDQLTVRDPFHLKLFYDMLKHLFPLFFFKLISQAFSVLHQQMH